MSFFLRNATPRGYTMAIAYSCLQKSLRRCDVDSCLYWSVQIGCEYPNALLKRLCQNALEDAGSFAFALEIVEFSKTKPCVYKILPFVVALAKMRKTHVCNWMNRVAVQKLYDWKIAKIGSMPSFNSHDELEFTAHCLVAHIRRDNKAFEKTFGSEARNVMKVYNFVNKDVLSFSCWHMAKRRKELRQEFYPLPEVNRTVESLLAMEVVVPDYCYCKHTYEGAVRKRGYKHFFENLVFENRVYPIPAGRPDASAVGGVEDYEILAKMLTLSSQFKSNREFYNVLACREEFTKTERIVEEQENKYLQMMFS